MATPEALSAAVEKGRFDVVAALLARTQQQRESAEAFREADLRAALVRAASAVAGAVGRMEQRCGGEVMEAERMRAEAAAEADADHGAIGYAMACIKLLLATDRIDLFDMRDVLGPDERLVILKTIGDSARRGLLAASRR